MPRQDIDRGAAPDDDNPEWTQHEMETARPALVVIEEIFGAAAASAVKRGRPANPARKINQTLRLDADVLAAYRQEGSGWQTLINRVLRAHMPGRDK